MPSNASIISKLLQPGAEGSIVSAEGTASAGTSTYATPDDLPLVNNNAGDTAFVESSDRLYIWTGTGWYNIALINTAPTITGGGAGSYALAQDGTPTVITLVAEDPEGLSITWSYAVTSGSLGSTATVSQADNVFTITPSTSDVDAGEFTITFTASDGVNIATDVNSFSLSFLSPLWDEAVLSIGTSNTNSLNNSTFVDRSANAHTITPSGTPTQTAFHPYLDNWSVEFDGTSYLYNSTDNLLGSGDFTIEAWVYPTQPSVTTSTRGIVSQYPNADSAGTVWIFGMGNNSGSGTHLRVYYNFGAEISTTAEMNLNQWNHIAWTREGATNRLFVNGILDTTFTSSADYSTNTYDTEIGTWNTTLADRSFIGNISNLRIINGTALYTGTFTPPTEKLTNISGTQILACQSNRFVFDGSYDPSAWSIGGTPKIFTSSPFGQESEYAVGENKGSGYFDGSGDWCTVTLDAFPTAFTVEMWVRFNSVPGSGVGLFDGQSSGLLNMYWDGGSYGTNVLTISNRSSNQAQFSWIPKRYEWYHLALVRESNNTMTAYVNGESIGSVSNGTSYGGGTYTIGGDSGNSWSLNGYIADFKITHSAVYSSTFTPPVAPVGNTNASLYLPMDNAGVFDKTGNQTLTLSGDPITETSVKKYDNSSIELDSNDAIVVLSPSTMHRSVPGDFTFESWVKLDAQSDAYKWIFMFRNTSDLTRCLEIRFGNAGFGYHLQFIRNLSGGTSAVYSINKVQSDFIGDFHHVAWTRTSGVNRVFFDGTQMNVGTGANPSSFPSSSWTDSTNILLPNNYILLGNVLQGNIEGTQWFNGYSKYTSSFTPPNRTQGRTYQAES